MEKTKEEFVVFMREAMTDCDSEAYRELYNFLVRCFVRADEGLEGRVYQDRWDLGGHADVWKPRDRDHLDHHGLIFSSLLMF